MNGQAHTFDSFECAIHALAPKYEHCGTRIVGHGLETDGTYYCCDHCAQEEGVTDLRDRKEQASAAIMRPDADTVVGAADAHPQTKIELGLWLACVCCHAAALSSLSRPRATILNASFRQRTLQRFRFIPWRAHQH